MSSFVHRVQAAIRERSDGQFHELQATLKPLVEEATEIYTSPYKYAYDPATALAILQERTMANLVRFFMHSALNTAAFQNLDPLFTGTGLVAEARLFAAFFLSFQSEEQVIGGTTLDRALKIQLVDSGSIGEVPLSELKIWALKLLSHPRANQVLNELVGLNEGTEINPVNLVPNVDHVHFFSSPDAQFFGFAGIDSLFINFYALEKAYQNCATKWPFMKECFSLQTKLSVALIGFHEAAHLAVRKAANDISETFTFASMKFNYFQSLDVGAIAQIRLLDLPMLNLEEGISSHDETIRTLFQYFTSTDALVPFPPVDASYLVAGPFPVLFSGIYKLVSPVYRCMSSI